jgi:hemerythrin-like metal-binding protein
MGRYLEWKAEYSVQHPILDTQHQMLLKIADDFLDACGEKSNNEKLCFLKALRGAAMFAKIHFTNEERLMEQARYPELAAHKKEHAAFAAEIKNRIRDFEAGKEISPFPFAMFLVDWVLDHIKIQDQKYVSCLRKAKLG